MMELRQIILDYKNKYQISNDELAKRLGVNKSTISRWLSGEVKSLQEDKMRRLSDLLGLDVETLLKGKMIQFHKPILGYVKAGYDLYGDENYLGEEEVTFEDSRKGDYFLRVMGESMEGAGIMDGDLVYIQQTRILNSGDIGVVLIGGEEATLKRVILKKDMMILEAANPLVENRYFSKEDIESLPVEIIGKAIYSKTEL